MNRPSERPSFTGGLPRRDLLILPALVLATMLVLLAVTEVVARQVWPEQKVDSCRIYDAVNGDRFRANCVSRTKAAEGPWVENRYNECGFRAESSCAPAPAGTLRVAMLGASMSQGYLVPYEDTVSAAAARSLEKACGRPVDFQNLGLPGAVWLDIDRQVEPALKTAPDAAVMVIAPFDLEDSGGHADGSATARAPKEVAQAPMDQGVLKSFQQTLMGSRTVAVAQHFAFRNVALYQSLYLRYGDKADFLRPPFTAAWRKRIEGYDRLLGGMADRLHAAGRPFLLVMVPQRAQAALLAQPRRPAGIDPSALDREIAAIAARHDIEFLDMAETFAKLPQPAELYYPVDGHLTPAAQPLVGEALARRLVESASAFQSCRG